MTMHYVLDLNRLHALLPAPRNMLDAAHHDGATCKYLKEGLSLATTLMYSTGKRSFTSICVTTEETGFCQLLSQPCYYQFLTCHQKKIPHTTIKVYLSRSSHVRYCWLAQIFQGATHPRLQLVLKGIKRTQALFKPCRTHLPIILQIMSDIKDHLSLHSHTPNLT